MRAALLLGTSAILLAAGALEMSAARGQPADHVRGQAIAERQCARCHATGRTGASPMPKAPQFRTLAKRYPIEQLAEALAEGIRTGHSDMPEFRLEPPEIGALLTYLNEIAER